MSIYSYFFNAVKSEEGTYDREYTAEDFANYLRKLVGDGVFIDPSTNLQVIAGSGMQVIVKEGEAWGKGHKLVNDADLPLTIEASDVALSRIDRVIFYIDYTNRKMDIRIKKGTNASSPQPPALQRDENIYEYCLAEVTVNRQAISITQSSIRDTRANSAVCGWVAGLISQIDTSTLFDQWNTALDENIEQNQSDFLTWFDNVKDTLTTTTLVRQYKTTYTTKIANEKTFDLLVQVAGRAGRENLPGKVIIQTYSPENFCIQCSKNQDYKEFYKTEIELRKQLKYPPFCDIILFGISSFNKEEIQKASEKLYAILKKYSEDKLQVMPPLPAPIDKIKNRYRWRIVTKCKLSNSVIKIINKSLEEFYKLKYKNIKISCDANPNNML